MEVQTDGLIKERGLFLLKIKSIFFVLLLRSLAMGSWQQGNIWGF